LGIKNLLDTLKQLGLSQSESKIYIYLSKKGAHRAHDICTELHLNKQQVFPLLKNLQNKGLIYATFEHPAIFYAISFEKVLDMIAGLKLEEARNAQKDKDLLFKIWQSLLSNGAKNSKK
jgi:HTH-type transcriptional regulator, sugar sensing transcriptional regulator